MNGSDITVVIPTYRRPRLLARALSSVIGQEIPGLRIHVFDNASGDETARVVRELGRRRPIDYTCHEANLGLSANFRLAIASVETPYCCILNDDDMQLPGLLSSALEILPAHATAGACCGRTLVYLPAGGRRGAEPSVRVQGASWQPGVYRAGQATGHMVREHFTPTGVVFSTRALRGARFDFGDMEMMARLAEQNDFVVSDRILGVYVTHPSAWSASRSPEEGRRMLLRRLHDYLELETLSGDERRDAVLLCVEDLMSAQYGHAFGAMSHGERSSPMRRDLARAAGMLAALSGARSSAAARLQLALTARLAGRSDAPPSGALALALRGVRKVAAGIDRLTTSQPRRTEAEAAALAEIAALDRSADAFFEGLRAERG